MTTTAPVPFADAVAGSTKAAMKVAGASSGDLWMVPIANIRVKEGFNVRNHDSKEYKERVRWIADSIKANGFYRDHPLEGFVVNEGGENIIYISGGHTRLESAHIAIHEGAELENLPVVVQPAGTSIEDLTVALVTKNNGTPLNPYEIGLVCKRLVDMGMAEKTIAGRLSYGKGYIANLLALVAAPKSVRDMVTSGQVSATLALETLKKEGSNAAKVLKDSGQKATELGKAKVTKKTVKKVTAVRPVPPKMGARKAKAAAAAAAEAPTTPDPVVDPLPIIRALTSALDVVMNCNVWETMSAHATDIVVKARNQGLHFIHGDTESAAEEL